MSIVFISFGFYNDNLSQSFKLQPTTSSALARTATFDLEMTAPMCSEISSVCTAPASLLQGTSAVNNVEPNQLGVRASNTIDGCQDGTQGTYNVDESVEWLRVVSVDPYTDQPWDLPLRVGGRAKIIAGLHAYLVGNDPSSDYADFYYSSDVDEPNWDPIQTIQLAVGQVDGDGFGNFTSESFTIAEDSTQPMHAIRVDFRYGGSPSESACTGGSWADTDDLAFYVAPSVPSTAPPTNPPVATAPPTNPPVGGENTNLRTLACGVPGKCNSIGGNVVTVPKTANRAVRCCRDPSHGQGDWDYKCDSIPNVWGQSNMDILPDGITGINNNCVAETDFAGAVETCQANNARLCTPEEMLDRCTRGTGCSFNKVHVWVAIASGDDCDFDSECASGNCTNGTCL